MPENLFLPHQVHTDYWDSNARPQRDSCCPLGWDLITYKVKALFTFVYVSADPMRVKRRQVKPTADPQFNCSGLLFIQIHQKYFTWFVWCEAL